MLNLTARCPYCDESFRTSLVVGQPVTCTSCEKQLSDACPDLVSAATVERCLTCPSTELFVRKDFPQRLGVAIVVSGFAASSVAWFYHQVIATFAILFATALVDVILYVFMGNMLECYRCHAQYRGLPSLDGHEGFELEVHERYRQQAARMQDAEREARAQRQALADPNTATADKSSSSVTSSSSES